MIAYVTVQWIDSSEKICKLGAYDMYGGFQLSGKAVFDLATNYGNENVQPGGSLWYSLSYSMQKAFAR